jgi:hypothetical protein
MIAERGQLHAEPVLVPRVSRQACIWTMWARSTRSIWGTLLAGTDPREEGA